MSWLQGGLGRLLHSSRPDPPPAAQQEGVPPTATAAAPMDKPLSLFGLLSGKRPSPPKSQAATANETAAAAAPQPPRAPRRSSDSQIVLDPGSSYVMLPCIKDQRPSRRAAEQLAAGVANALPGVRLDSSWVVYQTVNGSRQLDPLVCILPGLQPQGHFCSTAAVIKFLGRLQFAGVPLPGVLGQPAPPAAPAAAKQYAAAITAALQGCGSGFKFLHTPEPTPDSIGSDSTMVCVDAVGADAAGTTAAAAGLGAMDLQQALSNAAAGIKRSREQQLQLELHGAVGVAGQQHGAGGHQQQQQQQQQRSKRSRHSADGSGLDRKSSGSGSLGLPYASPPARIQSAAGGLAAAAAAGGAGAAVTAAAGLAGSGPSSAAVAAVDDPVAAVAQLQELLAGLPRPVPRLTRRSSRSSASQDSRGTQEAAALPHGSRDEEHDWPGVQRLRPLRSPHYDSLGGGSSQSQPTRLNRVDAKLQSIRRAAFVLGREPSMSAEMAAPVPRRSLSGYGVTSPTYGSANGLHSSRSALLPPRGPGRPSSGGGGSGGGSSSKRPATNTFSAQSDVKAMSKLDSLLRAKEAAAAMKAAQELGLPYEGTLEQRHHAMRQQLKQQLPDGRVPCAEGLATLQGMLSAQLPGARLDSEWLVYPATQQDTVPKLDILVRHPRIQQGHFRSYKAVVNFYSMLSELVLSSKGYNTYYNSKELLLPGLSILPDELVQKQCTGRSPGELHGLVARALATLGRSFAADLIGSPTVGRARSADSDGPAGLYPVGGTKAAAANAAAVAARQWQPPPLVTNLQPPRKGSAVLVLGMFYASEATAQQSHSGLAQYRDRVRLSALHKQVGYIPHSFDRDHAVVDAELAPDEHGVEQKLHVQGNFNSKRGAAAVADRFPNTRFSAVFCDYFRMPSGYAGDIYKVQLFLDFIPELVRRGCLPAGVPVYIPNSPVLLEQLATSGAFIDYGDVVAVPARCYPLYEATRHAETAGLMPAKYSNAGQARELVPGAEFIVVHYCGDATPPTAPLPSKEASSAQPKEATPAPLKEASSAPKEASTPAPPKAVSPAPKAV